MKKVSVIMPMYNVEEVMARSVQSLFSQTLEDFEVVFVDDCSVDNTGEELRRIISDYNREDISVKIIRHEPNKGVAEARNTGLDNATGEYVYYLDSDDYFDDDALSSMYEAAKKNDADVVGCEWLLSFENNARHMVQPEVKTGREAFAKMCNGVMRWNLWLFMLNAGTVSMIHRPLYHYIQTNSNAMTKNFAAYRGQVSENVAEVESYVGQIGEEKECQDLLNQLKLNLKLPLIISDKESDYKLWQEWFPESTPYAGQNPDQPFRTRLIQKLAAKRRYWLLKLYYRFVIKFVYGIIYR